jgi:hypothetical protein
MGQPRPESAVNVASISLRAALVALFTAIAATTASRAADTLVLTSGERLTGTFRGYRGGQFEFAPASGKPQRVPLIKVEALTLAPIVQVNIKRRGGRNLENVPLHAYQKPNFSVVSGSAPLSLPSSQVASIEAIDTLARSMEHMDDSKPATPVIGPDFQLPLPSNAAAVVHIHLADIVSSVRQGNYAQQLAAKRQIPFVRVEITGWDDPIARHYGITSAPQFWFYDRDGKRTRSLTERFTDSDIEAAIDSMPRNSAPNR